METIGPILALAWFVFMIALCIVLWKTVLTHRESKPTVCFFCGLPITGTTHLDRWHSKTRRRLPCVYVCDEHFDNHPPIPEA